MHFEKAHNSDSVLIDSTLEYELNYIDHLANHLVDSEFYGNNICVLKGEMGAGKTALVKALVKALGLPVAVSSPTFSLVNEYISDANTVYHIDLYRLDNMEEALEMGIEDYLHSGKWVFIEWPELIETIIPKPYLCILLENSGTYRRIMHVKTITNESK